MNTDLSVAPVPKPKRSNSIKFFLAGAVIIAVIAFLAFQSFQSNSMYYLTVSEARAQAAAEGDAFYARQIRISGPLHKESIQWNAKAMDLRFHVEDGTDMLPVEYNGVAPDTMSEGESVVVEGKYTPAGTFIASNILVKCPSKYEAATPQAN